MDTYILVYYYEYTFQIERPNRIAQKIQLPHVLV